MLGKPPFINHNLNGLLEDWPYMNSLVYHMKDYFLHLLSLLALVDELTHGLGKQILINQAVWVHTWSKNANYKIILCKF